MATITLSTGSIISLAKLENAVRAEYGKRFNLSDDKSQFNLIKLAGESSNRLIIDAFLRFFDGLPKEDKDTLIYRGVAYNPDCKKQGALVDESTLNTGEVDCQHETGNLPPGVKKITYRGNVTYKKDGVTISNPWGKDGEPGETESNITPMPSKQKTRVYRGIKN